MASGTTSRDDTFDGDDELTADGSGDGASRITGDGMARLNDIDSRG